MLVWIVGAGALEVEAVRRPINGDRERGLRRRISTPPRRDVRVRVPTILLWSAPGASPPGRIGFGRLLRAYCVGGVNLG